MAFDNGAIHFILTVDRMGTPAKRILLVAGLVSAVIAAIWLVRMSYVLTD